MTWFSGLASLRFASPLGLTAWAVLLGVPVGIIALYFLKLRRRPVQVPSTLLWKRSLEDLHVNSLFQRLRRNLLLFLQLLVVLLAMLALTGPRMQGSEAEGDRFVLAIDNSASMSATDVAPSRLEYAKEEAKKIVREMDSDALAMVIAFSDRAEVVSHYTSNRSELLRRIDAIAPTEARTSLREALEVAAGLANPAKQIGEGVVATEALITPKLKIYTDGGFPDVEGFSLGNLEPEVIVIGPPPPPIDPNAPPEERVRGQHPSDNVAILALQTRRSDERPDEFQVFGRVHNFRDEPVETEAKLLRHDPDRPGGPGTLIDAIALSLPAQADESFKFDLPDLGAVELEVQLDVDDALAIDNRAFTIVPRPRTAQVLLVTRGNRYLVNTLRTPTTGQFAEVTVATPDEAEDPTLARAVLAGRFDLIIYDGVRPDESPPANTLYFGALPPGPAFEEPTTLNQPTILDWDIGHPMMQYIRDLSIVRVLKGLGAEPPPGSAVLIESDQGPLAFVVPREGYADAVVSFPLLDGDAFNTDWFLRLSFPLFMYNTLRLLGNVQDVAGDEVNQPGQPVVLRADARVEQIEVVSPRGERHSIRRSPQGTYVFNQADTTGIYHARWGQDGGLAFAVNLFDPRESDLSTRGLAPEGVPASEAEAYKIRIGYNPVSGISQSVPVQKDWWKLLAVLALGFVLFEWYIYNRRIYI